MLYWDQVWQDRERALDKLSPAQRASLALGCLDDVLVEYKEYFDMTLDESQKRLIASVIDGLRSGHNGNFDAYVTALDEEAGKRLAPGVYDVLMGLAQSLNTWHNMSSDDALEAMSFAYQSILDKEILSKLETETLESEVRQMEANDRECLRTIGRQLELLALIESQ